MIPPWIHEPLSQIMTLLIAAFVAVIRAKVKDIIKDVNAFFTKIRCLEARTQILEHERKVSMNDIVLGIALKWVVSEVATSVGTVDPAAVKTKIHAAVAGAFHAAWLTAELDKLCDDVVDAVFKVLQDQPDLLGLLKALSAKDMAAAEAAAKALILPVVGGDLKALLAAA